MVKGGPTENGIFGQRYNRSERANSLDTGSCGRKSQPGEITEAKTVRQESTWNIVATAGNWCGWGRTHRGRDGRGGTGLILRAVSDFLV